MCSTGNFAQYSVKVYIGKEAKKRVDICICVTGSFCSIAEANMTLSINYK